MQQVEPGRQFKRVTSKLDAGHITKIMSLSNLLSNSLPNVQIDPTAFEQYGIQQVPALVVDKGDCFDVIYGNLPIDESLRRLYEKGECQNKSESRV